MLAYKLDMILADKTEAEDPMKNVISEQQRDLINPHQDSNQFGNREDAQLHAIAPNT